MLTAEEKILANDLFKVGAIKFGAFRLVLHDENPQAPLSPFYIDLRIIRSFPKTKKKVVEVYRRLLRELKYDLLADVPTAATPIVSTLSDVTGIPMISPKVSKAHGSGAKIDGVFKKGQTAVLIDDLITQADSKFEAIKVLEDAGLKVKDIVILFDREQSGVARLKKAGYKVHVIFGAREFFKYYADSGKITKDKYKEVLDYLG